jgi:hypothetical protein
VDYWAVSCPDNFILKEIAPGTVWTKKREGLDSISISVVQEKFLLVPGIKPSRS